MGGPITAGAVFIVCETLLMWQWRRSRRMWKRGLYTITVR